MQISTDHITHLLTFQEMDTRLGDDRGWETEQVFLLLDVLKEEATARALDVYTFLLKNHHPDAHPWSAIRVMDISEFPNAATVMERKVNRAPPALFLILNRRPELEPNKIGDELSFDDPKWPPIWEALKNWSPGELKARIGPNGWKDKQFGIKLPPPPQPKPGPVFTPVPRPPIPDPPVEPPLDTSPPGDPAPPLDPVEPEPPTEEPPEAEPPETEPPDDVAPYDDDQPAPSDSSWKELGVTAAWAVGVGALAYWLGTRSST